MWRDHATIHLSAVMRLGIDVFELKMGRRSKFLMVLFITAII